MSWLAAVRSLQIAASALVAGAIAFELLVLWRSADAARAPELLQQVRRWLKALGLVGIGVGLVTWAAWLAYVTIGMTGLPPGEALSPGNLHIVIARTTFGHTWAIRSVLFLLLAIGLMLWRPSAAHPSRWPVACCAAMAAALMGSLAWAGHAVASHPAHVWVDAAHLCAAALWLGMLPPLALLVHRAAASRDVGWLRLAGRAAQVFSPPAVAAVLVLAVSGSLNSWWLVGSPDKLLGSAYGLLLSAKLALFALMLALAASNRLQLTPRIAGAARPDTAALLAARRLRRNVLAEMLLAAALIGVVGTLGVTPPAVHEQPAHHHHEHDHEHDM